MQKKKKYKYNSILLGILIVTVIVTLGMSFALWQITLIQEEKNIITTGCFKLSLTDKNPIDMKKAYPISDEEGKSLTPYEFTIINTCDSNASYEINLEILEGTTLTNLDYIKIMLNQASKTAPPSILTTKESVDPTLPLVVGDKAATASFKLLIGELAGKDSVTYNLRLWLDENTPSSIDYMNKTLKSKITVTTSFLKELTNKDADQN